MRMRFVSLMVILAACGDGSGNGAVDAAGSDTDADVDPAPHFESAPSSLWITEMPAITGGTTEYSRILGAFRDGALPTAHDEVMREGACRLLTYEPVSCDPLCTDGMCVDTDQCAPYPAQLSAGTLTITGLYDTLNLDPDLGRYWHQDGMDLYAPGATVTVSASGADVDAFELSVTAPGGDNPTVDQAGALDFPRFGTGTGHTFTWTPVDPGSRVRLWMAADVAHGQPYAAIVECDAPDTGSLTIAADILDGFIDPQNWSCGECPEQYLMRYRRATTPDDSFELLVGTRLAFFYWGSFE
jgi:hypothetical protein